MVGLVSRYREPSSEAGRYRVTTLQRYKTLATGRRLRVTFAQPYRTSQSTAAKFSLYDLLTLIGDNRSLLDGQCT